MNPIDDNVTIPGEQPEPEPPVDSARLPSGGRRATIRDVAAAARVSTVTVSRVVNEPGLVRRPTRERVEAAMRALGYMPNIAARTMRTNTTRCIGCIVPDLINYSNAAIAQAAERHLAAAGYALFLASSDYDPEAEARTIMTLGTQRVDALLLYVIDETSPAIRDAIARLDVPYLVLDRRLERPSDRLLSDHRTAMQEAVRYLHGLGHRRLALMEPDLRIRPVVERVASFRAAAGAHGLGPGDATIVAVPPDDAERLRAAHELLASPGRPTAVLAEGSRQIRALLAAARERQLAIPADLSVIGLDAADIATVTTPELTTISRDYATIGRLAASLLLERLADPRAPWRRLVLESEVVLRGSCAPPRTSPARPVG